MSEPPYKRSRRFAAPLQRSTDGEDVDLDDGLDDLDRELEKLLDAQEQLVDQKDLMQQVMCKRRGSPSGPPPPPPPPPHPTPASDASIRSSSPSPSYQDSYPDGPGPPSCSFGRGRWAKRTRKVTVSDHMVRIEETWFRDLPDE